MAPAQFPAKLDFLFSPKRYKVAYGGRGGAKSWNFARALLILAAEKPMRILCVREVQKSIKQSVHRLLCDQIQALDIGPRFEVLETGIRGRNGSLFAFAGLAAHSVESIKSFEGFDVVWVEEAQTVSKRSWDILIPTIRKPASEIWLSFNPDLDSDDTYQRFVVNPPEDCVSVKVNWSDNPWFPKVLEAERRYCEKHRPKDYPNIWEGMCKAAVDGAIFAEEISAAQDQRRVCGVPHDAMLKVHIVFDLGWNDAMAIALVQRSASELRVIEYIEDSHKTLDHYSALLRERKYNWGTLFLPHDGANKDFKTGKSSQEILQALGWAVQIVARADVEEGIRIARMTFPRVWFDREKTRRLVDCLKHYRRHIALTTNEAGAPLHDEYSHGADCFRYLCVSAEQMTNEEWGGVLNYRRLSTA